MQIPEIICYSPVIILLILLFYFNCLHNYICYIRNRKEYKSFRDYLVKNHLIDYGYQS